MGKIKEELVTFGKAELTASCASVVDFGLAFFLSDIIGIYYGLANALGVISGGITNCILNYRYVFGDSKSKKKSVAWRYFIIWGISWMLNSGGTIALTEFLNAHEHIQLHYMIPKSIVSLLVAIFVNYPGQKKFVLSSNNHIRWGQYSVCALIFFCILAGNLLASGHKKEFGLSPDIPNPRLFLTNLLSTIHYFSVCKITSFFL